MNMERNKLSVVFRLLICGVVLMTHFQSLVLAESCDTLTVTEENPVGDTITWSDSAQHCTERWLWIFKGRFSKGVGIVIAINDIRLLDDDTLEIYDSADFHRTQPVRTYTSHFDNTAPVLLHSHHAVIVANTSKRLYRDGFSRFNFSVSAHPIKAIPADLHSGFHDIGSRYKYNCSSISDLPLALRCDMVKQCVGGEDEQQCDYLQSGCGDWLPHKDRCLRFVFSLRRSRLHVDILHENAPFVAEKNCKVKYNASLVHILDDDDKAFVTEVLKRSGFPSIIVGLKKVRTTTKMTRGLYRFLWQWGGPGGPIAYREQQIQREGFNDKCARLEVGRTSEIRGISCTREGASGYVCSKPNPQFGHAVFSPLKTMSLPPADKTLNVFSTKQCVDHSVAQTFLSCPDLPVITNNDTSLEKHGSSAALADIDHNLTTIEFTTSGRSLSKHSAPSLSLFQCRYGEGVHFSLTCDGIDDCPDGSDEVECDQPQSALFQDTFFACKQTQLIPNSLRCNGLLECLDESDEQDCSVCFRFPFDLPCPHVGCVPDLYKTYAENCPTSPARELLINLEEAQVRLDGYGMSRLAPLSAWRTCPNTHFQCSDGYCIPTFLMNNGEHDCPHGEDEMTPSVDLICPGFYRCRKVLNCIHPDYVCDGVPHCPFRDDELFCHLKCPTDCQCQGFAFACKAMFDVNLHLQVRYLDLSGVVRPTLVDLNVLEYLHFLNISSCQLQNITLKNLRHLRILDVSNNIFTSLTSLGLEKLGRLQYLDLSLNPFARNLDLNFPTFLRTAGVLQLETLVLRSTAVEHVQEGVFAVLPQLVTLDLRGSPIDSFDLQVFRGLTNLRVLKTDNSRLCCALPEYTASRCEAPVDELSSCHDLLRSDFFRVFLWVVSILAITGNVAVFLYRLIRERGSHKGQAFPLLVQNLCVADCLMGVYLMIIGVADSHYRGFYFTRASEWTSSLACRVAGFLALLSSEVSAFFLCLVTIDRLLVICLPLHKHLHLTPTCALLAALTLWGVGFLLALVPLLPPMADWHFYGQTGICLPLPITRHVFPGHGYTFGVFIVLNFLLFLVVGVGQLVIFRVVRTARRAATSGAASSKRREGEMKLARRLFLVALSDFCCWFPIGLLGLLAQGGVAVPGQVNVWAAVFVLPVNSALNPFLYTLNALLEKIRTRQQQQKTQRMIACLHAEIDRWPADRVEALFQHCLRKRLSGREITLNAKETNTLDTATERNQKWPEETVDRSSGTSTTV